MEEEINMSTDIEQAHVRIGHALDGLNEIVGEGNLMLPSLAKALVHADGLLSALSLIHDALYDVSKARGLIGRRSKRKVAKRQQRATR